MRALFIFLISITVSFSVSATEPICEPHNAEARAYSTLKIQIMGLIPIKDKSSNQHLFKLSNATLVPYLKELCKTNSTSEDILRKMLSKCQETVQEIVDKENLTPYKDNCELGYSLARAYVMGAKSQAAKCENPDGISDVGREIHKTVEENDAGSSGKKSSSAISH